MTTQGTATQVWEGRWGTKYTFQVYAVPISPNHVPANYIFARLNANNAWTPLYIGETSDLADRLTNHEKWPCASQNGVTHIHAHTSPANEAQRKQEEADLIARWSPMCNG